MAEKTKSAKGNSLIDQVKQKLKKTPPSSSEHAVDQSNVKQKIIKATNQKSLVLVPTEKVVKKCVNKEKNVAKQNKRKRANSSNSVDEVHLFNKVKSLPGSSANTNCLIWNIGSASIKETQEESSSDDEEVTQGEQKKRRKQSRLERENEAAAKEAAVRQAELSRVSGPRVPETEHDYRELLLSNSSCSATWIQYISFLLAAGEHERARSVARNGLAKIPCEEQQERLNLWTVLLRLEALYCNDPAIVETTLHEAINNCDPFTILCNMADIHHENNMPEKAVAVYRRLTKKFYAEVEAWVKFGEYYFKTGRLEEARETLVKCLHVLKDKQKSVVDITNRFAQMEMKYGQPEEACIMFESLVANYPKRLDVWNVFVDLLVKRGDYEQARAVFKRMHALPIRFNKKLSTLRKWRDFEAAHGDLASQKHIKKIMEDFSQQNLQ